MSYKSYPPPPPNEEDVPSRRYNPKQVLRKPETPVDQSRFEYYMNEPKLVGAITRAERYTARGQSKSLAYSTEHRQLIDVYEKQNGLYHCFEEWNSKDSAGFWDNWVDNEIDGIDEEASNNRDGSWTFANNIAWMRYRATVSLPVKMFIAYTTLHAERHNTESIIIAVCVFVQPGEVYTTVGITKSQQYSRQYKGSAFELQQYIAKIVQTKIDPRSKGNLFRPNKLMRDIMLCKFGAAKVGSCSKSGLIGGYVGSNWDILWIQSTKRTTTHRVDTVCDADPSILQSQDGIRLRFMYLDKDDFYKTDGSFDFIPHPFWEPPSPYPNPNSPNNPQLPLVFFPIRTLRWYADGAYHCD